MMPIQSFQSFDPMNYVGVGVALGILFIVTLTWFFASSEKSTNAKRRALLKLFKNKEDVEIMQTYWELD